MTFKRASVLDRDAHIDDKIRAACIYCKPDEPCPKHRQESYMTALNKIDEGWTKDKKLQEAMKHMHHDHEHGDGDEHGHHHHHHH